MDLALTARTVGAEEARRIGLVSTVVPASVPPASQQRGGETGRTTSDRGGAGGRGRGAVVEAALRLASAIAAKPQLAVQGTKRVLLQARYDTLSVTRSGGRRHGQAMHSEQAGAGANGLCPRRFMLGFAAQRTSSSGPPGGTVAACSLPPGLRFLVVVHLCRCSMPPVLQLPPPTHTPQPRGRRRRSRGSRVIIYPPHTHAPSLSAAPFRDQPRVSDGLDYVATWNSAQLLTADLARLVGAQRGGSVRGGGGVEGGKAAGTGPGADAQRRSRL
jgi:hypothetical protein